MKRAKGSVYQRSNNGLWIARLQASDGRRVSRSAKTRAEAEVLLAKMLLDPDFTAPAFYTVETWLDEYLKRANQGKAPATINDRRHLAGKIKTGLGSIRLDRLTAPQIQKWVDGLTGAHRTRLKSVQLLRSALNEALALGHVPKNVALPVKVPRGQKPPPRNVWTADQARHFLEVNADLPKVLLWKLALQTGARIGELLALKVTDFDEASHTLTIERTVSLASEKGRGVKLGQTKTEAGRRRFPLPPDAEQTIRDMLARRRQLAADNPRDWQDEGFLFPNEQGRLTSYSLTRRTFQASMRRAVKAYRDQQLAAGVSEVDLKPFPELTTHDLRRTFISLALRRRVQPEVVARMVGHSSPIITLRIYREIYQDEFDEARERIQGLI